MVIDMVVSPWMYIIFVWILVWTAVASWKAARKGDLLWFVSFFFFLNLFGILPIIYILFFQNLKFVKSTRKKGNKKISRKKKAPTL